MRAQLENICERAKRHERRVKVVGQPVTALGAAELVAEQRRLTHGRGSLLLLLCCCCYFIVVVAAELVAEQRRLTRGREGATWTGDQIRALRGRGRLLSLFSLLLLCARHQVERTRRAQQRLAVRLPAVGEIDDDLERLSANLAEE